MILSCHPTAKVNQVTEATIAINDRAVAGHSHCGTFSPLMIITTGVSNPKMMIRTKPVSAAIRLNATSVLIEGGGATPITHTAAMNTIVRKPPIATLRVYLVFSFISPLPFPFGDARGFFNDGSLGTNFLLDFLRILTPVPKCDPNGRVFPS